MLKLYLDNVSNYFQSQVMHDADKNFYGTMFFLLAADFMVCIIKHLKSIFEWYLKASSFFKRSESKEIRFCKSSGQIWKMNSVMFLFFLSAVFENYVYSLTFLNLGKVTFCSLQGACGDLE